MGRRKIEIQPIVHERNRSVTFQKRKHGLFKKAYELGVLCSVDIAIIIVEQRPGHGRKLYEYASSDIGEIIDHHMQHVGEKDMRGPLDYVSTAPNGDVDDPEDYREASPLLLESPGSKRGREEQQVPVGHAPDERVNSTYGIRSYPTTQNQHPTKKPRLSPATIPRSQWVAQREAPSISQHPNYKHHVEQLARSSSYLRHALHLQHPVQFNHLSPPPHIPSAPFFGPPSRSSTVTINPPALPDPRIGNGSLVMSKIPQDEYAISEEGPCNIAPDLPNSFFHALEGTKYPDSSHVGDHTATHGSCTSFQTSGTNIQNDDDFEWPVHNARRYIAAPRPNVRASTEDANAHWLDYLSGTSTSIEIPTPHPTAVNRWPTPTSPLRPGFGPDSDVRGEHLVGGGGKDVWMNDLEDPNRQADTQGMGRGKAGIERGHVHVKEQMQAYGISATGNLGSA